MERIYVTPEMEITEFETEDVITVSCLNGNSGTAGDNEGAGSFGELF